MLLTTRVGEMNLSVLHDISSDKVPSRTDQDDQEAAAEATCHGEGEAGP